jgi:hypothetical protein
VDPFDERGDESPPLFRSGFVSEGSQITEQCGCLLEAR